MAWPLLSTEPIMQYRNWISPDSIANIRKIFQFPMLAIKKLEKVGNSRNYMADSKIILRFLQERVTR